MKNNISHSKKKLTLQNQLFLSYLLITSLIICVFSIFFYYYTSKIIIQRETSSLLDITSTIEQQTDQNVQGMDTVSINIGYSNLIQDKLANYGDITVASDDFLALTQLFVAINGTDSRVDQINLYNFDGNIIKVGSATNISKVDMNSLPWLSNVLDLDGGKYISLPYESKEILHPATSSDYYISLRRIFYNKYGKEVGIVETTKKCKSIFKNIITYKKKYDYAPNFYIYDNGGNLIYPYNYANEKEQFPEYDYFSYVDKEASNGFFEPTDSNSRELITYVNSGYTDWTYVSVQSEDLILAPVNQLTRIIVAMSLLVFITTILLSYIMARKLTNPITQLIDVLNKTSVNTLGNSNFLNIDTSYDEFTQLTQTFEQMSQNLKVSMNELVETRQQEEKSRSLALQSQINPHFYYNTLASIQVLAENEDHESIQLMSKYMTSIMRYITGGNFTTVTLRAEIDCIRKYLFCMKVRYQSSLEYDIQIPDKLLDKEVPKLIIQPLVENSLKHGTECIPPWHIEVIGMYTDTGWEIMIKDNGPGFSDEALELIDKRIKETTSNIGMPSIEIEGMGILNVYLRWKIFGGKESVFEYGNTDEGHAYIIIGKRYKS